MKHATVAIFGLRNVEDRSKSINPTNVSGDIAVILDIQNNDETVKGIGLTLNDEEIQCRGDIGADLAASSGQIEVDCFLDTNAVDGECMGMQMEPRYANGEYNLGAFIITAEDERREVVATQPITLKNSGYVIIVHEPGEMSVVSSTTKGLTFHGGPAAEGNVNSFHACPVSYTGTTVGEMTLGAIHTNTARPAVATDPQPAAGSGQLSFRRSSSGSHAPADGAAPFTWPISTASWSGNRAVENEPGENEFWIENRGLIKDADGLDVTGEFRADETHKEGPFHFDFSAPRLNDGDDDSEIEVSLVPPGARRTTRSIAAGEFLTPGSSLSPTRLVVSHVAEGGVGGVTSVIAVGDCSVAANTDSRSSTAFVPGDGMDNVRNISELPEDDGVANVGDEGGLDCYTAELQELKDAIGNSTSLSSTRVQSAGAFGVDKTPPEVTDIEPDGEVVLGGSTFIIGRITSVVPVVTLEADDPDLETGDEGSGLFGFSPQRYFNGSWRSTGANYSYSSGLSRVSNFVTRVFDLGELDDGPHRLRVIVWDRGSPGNLDIASYSIIKDTKAPTFSLGGSPGGALNAGSSPSVTVSVSGTISDANPIEKALLTVMTQGEGTGSSNDICGGDDTTDTALPRSRARQYNLENDTKTIAFDQSITIQRPAGGGVEQLCFNLDLADSAVDSGGDDQGNTSMYSAGSFSVNWGLGVTVSESELTLPEGSSTPVTYTLVLESAPIGDVEVTPVFSDTVRFFVDPPTYVFTPTAGGTPWNTPQTVNVGAREDANAVNEKATITHTASGGGYGNVSIGSVAVTQADNDATLAANVTSIDEGAIDTVRVSVELATAATGSAVTVTIAETHNVPTGGDDEAPTIAKVGPGASPTATDRDITIPVGSKMGYIDLEIEVGELTRNRRITVTATYSGHGSGSATLAYPTTGVRIALVNDGS